MASIFDSMPDYGSFIQNFNNQTGLGTPQVSSSDFTRIPLSSAPSGNTQLINYDSQNPMTFSMGSSAGGGSQPLSAAPSGNNAMMPSMAPSNGGVTGFVDHLLGSNIYSRIIGALQGGAEGAYGGFPNALVQSGGNPAKIFWNELMSTGQGIEKGFMNPQQQSQDYQQAQDAAFAPLGSSAWAPKFVANTITDPLSYIPLEKPLSIAGNAIKAGSDLVGLTPYVTSAVDAIKASKPVSTVTNILKDAFSKNWDASPDVKQGLTNLEGNIAADKTAIQQHLINLAQTHGLTPDEVHQLPEVFESGGVTDNPKLAQAYQDLNNTLYNGVTLPDNFKIGTNAETSTMFNGNPLLDPQKLIKGYYPQRYSTELNPQLEQKMQELLQGNKKGFTINGPFNQERLFNNVAEAEANGFFPERNAYAAIAQRLGESSKTMRTAQFLQDMMDKGVISKEAMSGMKPSEIKPLSSYFDVIEKRGKTTPEAAAPNPLLQYAKPNEIKTGDTINYKSGDGTVLNPEPVKVNDVRVDSQGNTWINPEGTSTYFPKDQVEHVGSAETTANAAVGSTPFSLPKELSKAAPRYSSNPLKFESDLDRAAYIVGNAKNPSARDADFLKLVMDHTGLGEGEARNLGGQVRDAIKNIVSGAEKGSTVKVPSMLENYLRDRAANETSAAAEAIGAPLHDMGNVEHMQEGAANDIHDAANFESLANSPDANTTIDKVVKVNPYFVKPADEKAINEYLNPSKPTGVMAGLGKLNNLFNEGFLLNPLPHMHNIGINGMYLGGAKPEYVADAFKDIRSGVSNPWHDEAVRSGAVSSMHSGNVMKSVSNAMKKKGALGKTVDAAKYLKHGLLWETDAAIRTAIYRQAREEGLSSAEAAAKTNKFMGDYNNLTPFEKKYVKPLVPFYSWKKSNIPLQLSQMVQQTPKYVIYNHLKDAISQAASGQPTDQKGRIQTGIQLPDGSHVAIDPYSPMDEPAKIAQKGIVPWALGSLNPFFKEAQAQLGYGDFPVKYDSQAPMDYNARRGIAHAINSLNPIGGSAMAGELGNPSNGINTATNFAFDHLGGNPVNDIRVKDTPGQTSTEMATKLLGGFTARDNPAKDALNQRYQQRSNVQDQLKYLKDTGQPISKAIKRQAYQKVR